MSMHIQDFDPTRGVQYADTHIWKKMLNNMKVENNVMFAEKILHEASTVFQAARQHASELSKRGVTDDEFHAMRVLIAHVAAHTYTSLGNNNHSNFITELRDLKIYKEVIFRTAEMQFGHTSNVLNEFKCAPQHSSFA